MLLTGSYARSLDDKHRVAIPKPLREAFGQGSGNALYVAPGTDSSLALYGEEAFAVLAARLAEGSPTDAEVRDYMRLFYAQAARIEPDRQARVRIPLELVKLARLEKDVVLLGIQDHLELWDAGRWETYLNERRARYDQIAEAAFHSE